MARNAARAMLASMAVHSDREATLYSAAICTGARTGQWQRHGFRSLFQDRNRCRCRAEHCCSGLPPPVPSPALWRYAGARRRADADRRRPLPRALVSAKFPQPRRRSGHRAKEGKRFAIMWELQAAAPIAARRISSISRKPALPITSRRISRVLQLNIIGERKVKDFDGSELSEKALAAKYGIRFTPTFQFFPKTAAGLNDLRAAKARSGARARLSAARRFPRLLPLRAREGLREGQLPRFPQEPAELRRFAFARNAVSPMTRRRIRIRVLSWPSSIFPSPCATMTAPGR